MMVAISMHAGNVHEQHNSIEASADTTYHPITSYSQLEQSDTTNYASLIFNTAVANAEKILDALTIDHDKWSLAIYPAASYSGQSGFAIGLMPMLTLDSKLTESTTIITPSVLVSTKGMWEAQCDADIYLKHRQTITAKAEFFYQPDKYYGLASTYNGSKKAEYNIYRFQITASYQKEFTHGFKLGPAVDFSNHHFRKIKTLSTSIADSVSIVGDILASEGWDNAIGLCASYDSRDNLLYPHSGWYIMIKALTYQKFIGSDRTFNTITLDARKYAPLGEKSVLAFQLYASGISNNKAPYHKMATFGGTRLGRAIPHNLKYADRYAALFQGEVRFPLFWRIGGTSWIGAGSASHNINKEIIDNTQGMAGIGLRFKVFPEKGLNMRLDGGLSTKGEKAIYFNIREAF